MNTQYTGLLGRLAAFLGQHCFSQIFNAIFGIVFSALIVSLCWLLGESPSAVHLNLLVCVLGALLGWAAGMYFSPFDKEDEDRFHYVGKSLAAFVSGYVLSKAESLISTLMKSVEGDLSQVKWDRVGLFLCSFLLAATVVFVSRSYALRDTARMK